MSGYKQPEGLEGGAPGALEDASVSPNGYAQLQRGFEIVGRMPYDQATQTVQQPIACVDCHHPQSMQLRVTRPGFLNGIRALAFSDAPVPHLPSIEKWRAGGHQDSRDPNVFATRQGQLDLHGPAVAGLRQK